MNNVRIVKDIFKKIFLLYFQIPDQESARKAKPGDPFTFTVDASKTGWGEVAIDVVFENQSIRRTFYVEEVGERVYQVSNSNQTLIFLTKIIDK